MAEKKKAPAKKTRARTSTGAFQSDDPSTPNVNEAWVQTPAEDKFVWYESREKEPSMFPVADIRAIRNFQTGRLEYKVAASDVERFEAHHFVMNARIIRKA